MRRTSSPVRVVTAPGSGTSTWRWVTGAVSETVPTRLDVEPELGFVVGKPSRLGVPVPVSQQDFARHVFGVCLVDDWSARDLQAWEYVALGPFLGKSFATSASPWVVPLPALEAARVPPSHRDVPMLAYLDDSALEPWGLDVRLQVRLNGHVVSEPPCASTCWTGAQQLATSR